MASIADAPRVRPFATSVRDLDLDFAQGDRPQLIDAVLHGCVESPPGRLDAATLDRRARSLLQIVRETQGDRLLWKARCANEDCGHEMELELSVSQLLSTPEPAERFSCSAEPGCELELRLPTGRDQIEWRDSVADAEEEGVDLRMASSLVSHVNGQAPGSDWTLPHEWLPAIDAACREHDVLTAMELQVSCPWCEKESALEPDVEALALSCLAVEQKRVLEEIHQLAAVYHWTEAEVLALPPRRRAFYIARIGGEATA
jgi:hypothetical protein